MINNDIVYKPKRYLFELSRFPVRNDSVYRRISPRATFSEIANAIPTRDYQESSEDGNTAMMYWNSERVGSLNTENAMDSESYSFMNSTQKAEVIRNHLLSYLLEVYVKLMTGMNLGEYTFNLVQPPRSLEIEFVKLLTEEKVQAAAEFFQFNKGLLGNIAKTFDDSTGGVLFSNIKKPLQNINTQTLHATQYQPKKTSPSGVAGKISGLTATSTAKVPPPLRSTQSQGNIKLTTSSALNAVSFREVPKVINSLQNISSFSQMQTSISDGLSVSKKLLTPKQFDRVFNIVVDPDEFEIDVDKTVQTPYGKLVLEQMIKRGDVVSSTQSSVARTLQVSLPIVRSALKLAEPLTIGRPDPNVNNFKFRDRDRSEGDLMFEKYFVTIETFGEEDV
jgi:hypothetical protein